MVMAADLNTLDDAGGRARRFPIDYATQRLTQPQRDWLAVEARVAIWRGGNQLGKSMGMAVDLVLFARGQHPWQKKEPRHRAPVRILVVSYSWSQMEPFIGKIWALLPPAEIDPALSYVEGKGLRGSKEMVITLIDGPGRGSQITLATYKQGAGRIAGGTFHRAYLDEPPPQNVFTEVRPRLNRHRGHMRISFTPTLESQSRAPVDYLRKKVEAGQIHELHTELTEANTRIRGGLIEPPIMPQSEIDAFILDSLDVELGMRLRGDWEPVVSDRWLSSFGDHCITTSAPPRGALLGVGIDYGLGAGNQTAVLLAVAQQSSLLPTVWLMDEIVNEDETVLEEDARAVVEMLARNRLKYTDIDVWCGDVPTGKNKRGASKTNADMRHHLAAAFGMKRRYTKYIETPTNKELGSESRGLRLLKNLMRNREGERYARFRMHPRCVGFKKCVLNYNGGKWSPYKHQIDATRYIFEHLVTVGSWANARAVYS
jgi:phage terminase large subunit-like protein